MNPSGRRLYKQAFRSLDVEESVTGCKTPEIFGMEILLSTKNLFHVLVFSVENS